MINKILLIKSLILVSLLMLIKTAYAEVPPLTAPDSASRTESGLAHQLLTKGKLDVKPGPTDMVVVHYTGWLSNGRKFDDSFERGEPVTFPLDRVIKGWTEGLQLMSVGETRRFWIPQALAYGDKPKLGAPRGDLIFDVELIAIKQPKAPPAVPANLANPPQQAIKHASGLTSIILNPGTSKIKPKASSVVKVHYSGWDSQGNLIDSSIVRDEPLTAPLNRVISGWTIGIQMMTVGEKRRFWIPADLAYGSNPPSGAPSGQLVFDIELLSIVNL